MSINLTVQELVSQIRSHGLTQVEISERTQIPQPTISRIERGEIADVMSRTYVALAQLHKKVTRRSKTKRFDAVTSEA